EHAPLCDRSGTTPAGRIGPLVRASFSGSRIRSGAGEVSRVRLRGRNIDVLEAGRGDPLLYLHGFADVHGVASQFQPFHLRLAEKTRIIAPAHPGCAGTDEISGGYTIDDVLFHLLELLDAVELDRFDLVGHCVGGWIAAELAVRHPERVNR